jgi:hypothetical protein
MAVIDEGDGPILVAGAAGTAYGQLGFYVQYDEANDWWRTTGTYFNTTVFGLHQHDDTLYLGGSFRTIDDGSPAGVQNVGGIVARTLCPSEPQCYANCDGSTAQPVLNVDDFTCFITEFASAQSLSYELQVASYANCDNSTSVPVLNIDDFTCFINEFAAGCP